MQDIIIVDEKDNEIGLLDKMEVHKKGILHRAFSVFIFDSNGKMLIQKRASEKYHSPKLWSNACCSHHLPDKTLDECVSQRLMEEMGVHCQLDYQFKFSYLTEFENGLIENEIDHVYFGYYDDDPKINPAEVMDWKYIDLSELETDVRTNPENYTKWFIIIINRVILHFKNNSNNQ